jgi:hypothetical protein
MPRDGAEKTLSEARRQEIFAALVEAQDQNMTVDRRGRPWQPGRCRGYSGRRRVWGPVVAGKERSVL